MMENGVKKLNEAIEAAEERYERREKLFGFEHSVSVAAKYELEGLRKARRILFGYEWDKVDLAANRA